jgi:hypothetical protein
MPVRLLKALNLTYYFNLNEQAIPELLEIYRFELFMRQLSGLDKLLKSANVPLNKTELAKLVRTDLSHCRFSVCGQNQGQSVVIAEMQLIEEGLRYDRFDQRIDLTFAGELLATEVPLNYTLQGKDIVITGRCSLVAQVCGADLLLNRSFAAGNGAHVQQKFSITLKELSKASTQLF